MENRIWKGQISRICPSYFQFMDISHMIMEYIHSFMGSSQQKPDRNDTQITGK